MSKRWSQATTPTTNIVPLVLLVLLMLLQLLLFMRHHLPSQIHSPRACRVVAVADSGTHARCKEAIYFPGREGVVDLNGGNALSMNKKCVIELLSL